MAQWEIKRVVEQTIRRHAMAQPIYVAPKRPSITRDSVKYGNTR